MQAAAVNSASAASAGGLSTAVLVSHLSRGVKRQSLDDGLPESVATSLPVLAAKRHRFDTSASAHAAPVGEGIQQGNASAGGSDIGVDIFDDVASCGMLAGDAGNAAQDWQGEEEW